MNPVSRFMALFFLSALAGCATAGNEAGVSAVSAPKANTAPMKPVFVKSDVMGRDAAALDKLFGPAALVRREGAGEFRRYTFADCALIVILHPDENGKSVSGHLDAAAKSSGEEKPDLDACLAHGLPAKAVS